MQKNMFLFRQFVAEKEVLTKDSIWQSAYRNPARKCVPEPGAHMRTGTRRACFQH